MSFFISPHWDLFFYEHIVYSLMTENISHKDWEFPLTWIIGEISLFLSSFTVGTSNRFSSPEVSFVFLFLSCSCILSLSLRQRERAQLSKMVASLHPPSSLMHPPPPPYLLSCPPCPASHLCLPTAIKKKKKKEKSNPSFVWQANKDDITI